jgi:hypothetical protein
VISGAANTASDYGRQAVAQAQTLKAQNAVRDRQISEAQKAGYVMPPSEVNPGPINQVAAFPSGKIMTQQAASVKNQPVTDDLARSDVGLPKTAPLTEATFRQVRTDAALSGYEPLKKEQFVATPQYKQATDSIFSDYKQMISENPKMANPAVESLMEKLDINKVSGNTAIAMSKDFRNDASKAFRAGDNDMGRIYKQAAAAVEDLMAQNLSASGKSDMLSQFQSARQTIAKAHDYSDALTSEGGHIDARKMANANDGQMSGNAKVIANMGAMFNKSTQPLTHMQQLTAVDAMLGLPTALAGSAATGHIAGMLAALGPPAARLGSRALILSRPTRTPLLNQAIRLELQECSRRFRPATQR